ncbi:magnesium chelatase [Streptomyces sp. NPDC088817]|uniref:magnesium chelatase n=1 Tax=unclassified Streptomyces TaxID=2593676 RepID=UPI0036DFF475
MDVRDRVSTALACAAVDPGLAGVLLLDLDPALTAPLGAWLAALLPGPATSTVLPSAGTDDDLWVTVLPVVGGRGGFRQAPGPLHAADRTPVVCVVPDLSRAGLATLRAAVTTLGAPVAHLERDGRQRVWVPGDRWVSGCPTHRTARVSRHLLDRFALRIDTGGLTPVPDGTRILDDPPAAWRRAIAAAHAGAPLPPFSQAAADRVVALLPPAAAGTRRDLSLARTARALAFLAGEPSAVARHVDEAAALTALVAPAPAAPGIPAPAAAPALAEDHADDGLPTPGPRVPQQVRVGDDASVALPAQPLSPDATGPYPEDALPDEREAAPLRPPHHRSAAKASRGHPIGTTTATTTRDLSLTATATEAAKYQELRCPGHYADGSHPLHLTAADLRAHRRAEEPGRLLLLVLDHTSRRGLDWYPVLSPYLSEAYAARSRVAVVEIGAGGAGPELAASLFVCRSVLDRRISQALDRPAGRATPLAHGLHLVASLLRHETQHGGARVDDALLLVFTDGRANVPLDASHALRTPTEVGDRGVRDALEQASRIARLPRVRSVVLLPGPRPQEHLAARLADALCGEVIRADRAEPDAA